MGKKDTQQDNTLVAQQKQKNKSHKTLRQKLHKKRLQQKQHMKKKKQKRKQFDPEAQKRSFFLQHFNSISQQKYKQAKKQFKYKKVTKYIEKFINVYQDDLEDFFGLFKEFDEGGFIDISGLENKKLHKILVKLFGQLPLVASEKEENGRKTVQYKKKKQSTLRLENVIRDLVTKSIENYMENGTGDEKEKDGDEDSQQDQDDQKLKELKANKKDKDVTVKIRNEDDDAVFTLPKPKYQQISAGPSFGPSISAQQRQKIAELFERQLLQMQRDKQAEKQMEQDNFDKIFNSGQTACKLKNPQKAKKSTIQDFPQQLMAQGSARIGQKITIDEDEQKEYDAIHRPKKLIDEHRQIMAINRGQEREGSKRKPFDRQRDVVNSRNKFGTGGNMGNGLFFDFKDKMTAPKKTNSFL